jgi:septum formation protein
VWTAFCLRHQEKEIVKCVETRVTFRELTDEEIQAYIATGEPFDKAGGYGIQSGAAHMVRRIDGSYTNVVGLPLAEGTEQLLRFPGFSAAADG